MSILPVLIKEYHVKRRESNMSRVFVTLIGVLLLMSCREEERPEDILSKREMVRVLSEIYITEEKVNKLSLSRDSSMVVYGQLKEKMFQKLSVQDSVFRKSMNYYWDRPKELEEIYTTVIDSLNLRLQRVSAAGDGQDSSK